MDLYLTINPLHIQYIGCPRKIKSQIGLESFSGHQYILIANGSEVSLLCEVADRLLSGNINSKVVSIPSIGRFESQSLAYKTGVLNPGVPVFGLTAGLPSTLKGVVGPLGKVFGLTHFGASAPYKVLDEKFGFTVANITSEVLKFISK